EDGIRDPLVTGVQTCALPIYRQYFAPYAALLCAAAQCPRCAAETGRRFEPVHHTVVAMDVAGSGRRDDLLQLRMRADLHAIVAEIGRASGRERVELSE